MFRTACNSLGGPSKIRQGVFALPAQVPARNFQTSSPALKKRRATESDQEFDESLEEDSDELGLFDAAESTTSPGAILDRKSHRANIKGSILSILAAKGQERRDAMTELRVGSLRKVVQLSDTPEEIEELRGVFRTWRVLGGKVTKQTAQELVGRPDLAQEMTQDRIQYGFPTVTPHTQKKLQAALATYTPPSASAQSSST